VRGGLMGIVPPPLFKKSIENNTMTREEALSILIGIYKASDNSEKRSALFMAILDMKMLQARQDEIDQANRIYKQIDELTIKD
jgi:hypothetical protein